MHRRSTELPYWRFGGLRRNLGSLMLSFKFSVVSLYSCCLISLISLIPFSLPQCHHPWGHQGSPRDQERGGREGSRWGSWGSKDRREGSQWWQNRGNQRWCHRGRRGGQGWRNRGSQGRRDQWRREGVYWSYSFDIVNCLMLPNLFICSRLIPDVYLSTIV